MRTLLLSGLSMLLSITIASAQGVGVNTTGAPANSSAILDVSSTTQGMLVPRMTEAQRTAIASPATGLLVYQTDMTAGFYFYNGTVWTSLNGGGGTDASALTTGTLAAARMPALTGDITTSAGTVATTLANTAVTAGSYGSASQVPTYTVDSKGRLTAASNTNIAIAGSAITSGTVSTARLGSGTADNTTYLRGDGTWATVGGGWGLTGNAGTTAGTNFIGTTDNVDLIFKRQGVTQGIIRPTNIFFGASAGNTTGTGTNNVGIGNSSLAASTTGGFNTAIGYQGLIVNTTGSGNVAIGSAPLFSNTTGGENVVVGSDAMAANVAGSRGVAIGKFAMRYANSTATGFNNGNIAIGYQALQGSGTASANTGNNNSVLGYEAMLNNTSGGNNTAYGYSTLNFNTTGSNNIALGYQAGNNITTGANNLVIGYDVDAPSATGNNQMTIGNLIYATGVDGTGTTLSTGNVGIGINNPGAKLEVAGQVKITGGTPGAGKVLTSDATGLASWQTPSGGGSGAYTESLTNAVSVVLGTAIGDIASPAFSVGANKTAIVSVTVTGTNSALTRSFYITDGSNNVLGSIITTSNNQGPVVTVMAIINNSTGSAVDYKLRGICNTAASITITNYAVRKMEF